MAVLLVVSGQVEHGEDRLAVRIAGLEHAVLGIDRDRVALVVLGGEGVCADCDVGRRERLPCPERGRLQVVVGLDPGGDGLRDQPLVHVVLVDTGAVADGDGWVLRTAVDAHRVGRGLVVVRADDHVRHGTLLHDLVADVRDVVLEGPLGDDRDDLVGKTRVRERDRARVDVVAHLVGDAVGMT